MATDRALRPFWLHQGAEYMFGLVLVAQGLQSPSPLVPSLAGGLVLLNAAMVDGPFGAFRVVPRRVHRWFDVAVIAVLVVAALLPVSIDNTSRAVMLAIGAVYAFVWWNSSFATRVASTGPNDRSEAVGRVAGRLAGTAVRAARKRRGG